MPWGSYEYNILHMGVSSQIFFSRPASPKSSKTPFILVCIDDISIINNAFFSKHLTQIHAIFTWLRDRNVQVNLLKSNWVQDEIDCLDFVLAQNGIKAQQSKVDKIILIAPPKNKNSSTNSLSWFINKQTIKKQHVYILQPLTIMTIKTAEWDFIPTPTRL